MRSPLIFAVLLLASAAFADDISVKVNDPQSAAVIGAQVVLRPAGQTTPTGVQYTGAAGAAVFRDVTGGDYEVQVWAAGFAPAAVQAAPGQNVTVELHPGAVNQTVVVTATRTPVPSDLSGASLNSLDLNQLTAMQPVSTADAIRYLPGAIINTSGRRGSLSSLFVRGGDSRYNKFIVDGVPVDEPGGTFDPGTWPIAQTDRVELLRGAQSTLYGSDAMTSVVQSWTAAGTTPTPEINFGADGGTFETAHGYASVAGAIRWFDYNAFADQFNTTGQGVNDTYSNSLQGGNLGFKLSDQVTFRFRTRHMNSRTGVQNEWNFNGTALEPPDSDQWARQNNFLASGELEIAAPSRWIHRLTGFEYNHKRTNVDYYADPGRVLDYQFHSIADINRAGFDYQGDYLPRTWARTTLGYEFEDENGDVGDIYYGVYHGLRLNQAVYGQEWLTYKRLSVIAGARFVHNTTFGNVGVPRVAVTYQLLRGEDIFSGTQLRFSYGTGIKEPRFDESFANGPGIIPNPSLKAEQTRAYEAGVQQSFLAGKYSLNAVYYNNLFHNQIDFAIVDPVTFTGQYQNIDKSFAQGAEVVLTGRPVRNLEVTGAYTYTSTQILEAPFFYDPLHAPGAPLLRRPKQAGSLLVTYVTQRWGANLSASALGARPDSDFSGFGIDHAAGYVRADIGGWYQVRRWVTAYANVENFLNQHYNEVVGYPALRANFRAGLRFRFGGE
jgi:outer membrane cobalamin receptor